MMGFGVVFLILAGQSLRIAEDQRRLRGFGRTSLGLRNRGDEIARASSFDGRLVERLPFAVQRMKAGWRFIRRVQNRLIEKRLCHLPPSPRNF